MKEIVLLGSTGSIGTQSLEIIRRNSEEYKVKALACGRRTEDLVKQVEEFSPELAVTAEEGDAAELQSRFPHTEFIWGKKGLLAAGALPCDIVINALVGMIGTEPTLAAVKAGNDVALANKETLVAGGSIVMDAVKEAGVRLIPVDSEHSAVFQCIQGERGKIKRILLTASGGPFRNLKKEELKDVTLEDALKHPNWSMGSKITVDSATMMNKGLEVIEAKWLFDVDPDRIQVLVHPQSILHSAVETEDGSVIGQMGWPDMKLPIAYALSYPERKDTGLEPLDLFKINTLTFEKPDTEKFPALRLALEAIKAGRSYPVVLNAANEVLVEKFLKREIGFTDIASGVEKALNDHSPTDIANAEDIVNTDSEVRKKIKETQ